MATQAVTIAQDNTSDATWRAWGSGIKSALDAMGTIVQTSDTGQFNASTSTKSAGAYLMYRFDDSLQSTTPCFIRIDLKTNPQLGMSVGTGTDGAGTLTGNTLNLDLNNLTNTTTPQQYYFSSTTSRLTFWMEADTSHGAGSGAIIFTVERSRDNTGSESANGLICAISGSSHGRCGWIGTPGSTPGSFFMPDTDWRHAFIWTGSPTLIGTQMTAFAMNVIGTNYQVQNPPLGILIYSPTDLGLSAPGSLPAITMYGGAHAYINTSGARNSFGLTGGPFPMMLYE